MHNSRMINPVVTNPVIILILNIITLYEYVLITSIIFSFLLSFGILNRHQPAVQKINFALFRLTDPLLRPIRKYMPDLGGLDISPIVLILAMHFISNTLVYYSVR